jgi:ribosomal protein S18 acetylase RimI-like enzyme
MFEITPMTGADVRFATDLAQKEEWAYLESDFERLIDFEPDGCLVAWKGKKRVGIVTTTTYEGYAFVGSLIVEPAERGRGLGEELMRRAIGYLRTRSIRTIELDGVFRATSLYRRLGFVDKYLSLRFYGKEDRLWRPCVSGEDSPSSRSGTSGADRSNSGTSHGPADESCGQPLPYGPDDTVRLLEFDRETTGLSRQKVLGRLLEDYAASTIVAGHEQIRGYALVRQRAGGFFSIGPLVALDKDVARMLLGAVMSRYGGQTLAVGVVDANQEAVEMIREAGFKHQTPSLRMFLGDRIDYERSVYGIISPEKG